MVDYKETTSEPISVEPIKGLLEARIQELGGEAPNSEGAPIDKQKLPLAMKVFGVLCLLGGIVAAIPMVLVSLVLVAALRGGMFSETTLNTTIIVSALIALLTITSLAFIVFGIRLLRNRRRFAAQTSEVLVVLIVGAIVCDIMLFGISYDLIYYAVILIPPLALTGYIDPSLEEERQLQRKLRDLETEEQAEEGTLGRDLSGKGYISLNFFNLFWIFVVSSVIGLGIEMVYHYLVVVPGEIQDRAGMLFGPFSPIYGFGAVLLTLALNRFYRAPLIVVFLVSAVIGGTFEYLVSWFMEFAFGAVAWDYTGSTLFGVIPDPIAAVCDGRTSTLFMCMWGALGFVWIKVLLPRVLQLVNLIPWKLRYVVTTVCAALMILDGVMTLQALDCWYERLSGMPVQTPVEQFYAERFDNAYMENRFESMTIHPDSATRV